MSLVLRSYTISCRSSISLRFSGVYLSMLFRNGLSSSVFSSCRACRRTASLCFFLSSSVIFLYAPGGIRSRGPFSFSPSSSFFSPRNPDNSANLGFLPYTRTRATTMSLSSSIPADMDRISMPLFVLSFSRNSFVFLESVLTPIVVEWRLVKRYSGLA